MASVADLVDEVRLRELAAPGTLLEGRGMAERGDVELRDFEPLRVTATVAGEHAVELRAEGEQLAWSCSCPQDKSADACEHVVATALETWRRAPTRRR